MNPALSDEIKADLLWQKMRDIGVVHGGKYYAFEFYSTKRYDEFRLLP